ncbi:MAG TPA: hypothetical protein VFS43_39070 [Polyangiaceae bacterium]|nr:hypothetical protein [Polyangiaceae bacterium]
MTHFSPSVEVPPAAPGAPRAAALPRSKGVLAAVCGERPGCRLLGRQRAGVDGSGRGLEVATVLSAPPGLDPAPADGPAEPVAGDEGDEAEIDGASMALTEYWLLSLDEGQVVSSQLLAEVEGGGPREGDVKVGDNFFRLARSGGSTRQWEESSELRLSPLGPRSWSRRSWTLAAGATAYEEERWDWGEFRGRTVWFEEGCEGRERGASAPHFPAPGELPAEPYFAYASLPAVELDAAYASGLWRETGLGRCALRADGAEGGYALQGKADGPDDSSLRAVSDREGKALFVEVFDDRLVGAGGAAEDRLEVLVDAAAEPARRCGEGPAAAGAKPLSWTIRAADGALASGRGRPGQGAPRVEHARAEDGRSVRLKLTLPAAPGALTLIYHDTDDGRRVERSFASSRLRRGDARTLGHVRPLARREAVCAPLEGRLEPEFAASFDPYEPVIGSSRAAP